MDTDSFDCASFSFEALRLLGFPVSEQVLVSIERLLIGRVHKMLQF